MFGALSTIQRYIIAGLLVLIALNAGVSFYYKNLADKRQQETVVARGETELEREHTRTARTETLMVRKELEGVRSELEAAREAIKVREDELETINKAKEQSDAKLRNALRSNPSWGSAAVPDSVRNAFEEGAPAASGSVAPSNPASGRATQRLQNPPKGKPRNK